MYNAEQPGPNDDVESANDDSGCAYKIAEIFKPNRVEFAKKILQILILKLIITIIWSLIFVYVDFIKNLGVENNIFAVVICLGAMSTGFLLVTFSVNLTRAEFWNYALLTVFACFEGALIGLIVSYYPKTEVATASVICLVLSSVLVSYAWYTTVDFTKMGASIYSLLLILLTFRVILIFLPNDVLFVVYCVLGGAIFCAYVVISVQMINGSCANKFAEGYHVLTAIALYVIVLDLYLFVLQTVHIV